MGIKLLESHEVPADIRPRLDFTVQLLKKSGKSKRLYIGAKCSKCVATYARRVSDLKFYLKRNLDVVWLCPGCRVDARWLTNGYVMMYRPEHPNARKDGGILEHVFVMSEHIGRPLVDGENVHHKNGSRMDNRPENLELWSTSQPSGQRIEDKIRWAIELKDLHPQIWRRVRSEMLKESESN